MIRGSLDRLHLGDLLQWLQAGSLSGRLSLTEGGRERRLDFLDGRVVYASSLAPEERLASWLAFQGFVDGVTLRSLLSMSLVRRVYFTELLVEHGAISKDELRESITSLAGLIMVRVLAADEVRFTLDPTFPVNDLLGLHLNMEPQRLLLEAARLNDESRLAIPPSESLNLPFAGELFETFFWDLIREGVVEDSLLSGAELADLHQLISNIAGTLSQWLATSSGLVPVPSGDIARVAEELSAGSLVRLDGRPQVAWNQMVLACCVSSRQIELPEGLAMLTAHAQADEELWLELIGTESWHRPHAGRLDELTSKAVVRWSQAAAAAAIHLKVDPEIAALATHLLAVPTDLVLWVLARLPVSHAGVRRALLRHLTRRIGEGLTRVAGFPAVFQELFASSRLTPLGACLNIAREVIPAAQIWPCTVPDECDLLDVAPPGALGAASAAARDVVAAASAEPLRVV